MVALIPPLEDTRAYVRPPETRPQDDFARLLENVSRRAGEAEPPAAPSYTVQPGDNLTEIARKMGQRDAYALARANGLKDANLLRVGQVLQLAEGQEAPAANPSPLVAASRAKVRRTAIPAETRAGATAASLPANTGKTQGQMVVASWYGPQHHGRMMANGQPFDMHADTVAHPSLPLGTRLRLTNPDNGTSVDVKVTDRGPFIRGRNLDLSYGVAKKLGVVRSGVSRILMQKS